MGLDDMTHPRWHRSQREIETCIARGPKTIVEICSETGYSYNTVMAALKRAVTTRSKDWPARYTLVRSAFEDGPEPVEEPSAPIVVHIVPPAEIPMEQVGTRWQAGREKIGQEIADIDLQTLNLKKAIKTLEIEAASLLGIIVQLRAVKDGPDWRSQIGLEP